MSKRDSKLYLIDIKESIEKIEKYTKDVAFADFAKDLKTIDAVVRNLSIIGEAVKNIPDDIKMAHSEIAWHEIMGMRNKVVHEYFSVDEEILWKTIQNDLPLFKKQIGEILDNQ